MEDFDNYGDYLQAELVLRIQKNPQYSQRSFAKMLEISPGALSEIMSGKRKLSHKNSLKITKGLGLNKTETKQFLSLLEDNKEDQSTHDFKKTKLTNDTFSIVSNWYCFAILNLVDCEGFKWSYSYISKRLGISMIEAKEAVEKMVRVGLIKETSRGLKACDDYVLSPDGVTSRAIKNYHHSILKMADEALEVQTIEEREISGISLAINPKNLNKIKKDIDDFQRELIEKYCKGKRSEVYHLELALFKLTKSS